MRGNNYDIDFNETLDTMNNVSLDSGHNKDLSPESYQQLFKEAYAYAFRVIHAITNDTTLKQDILQDFSVTVLTNQSKYQHILQYKRTVYNVLRGIYANMLRKHKPEYTDNISDYEQSFHTQQDLQSKEAEYIESILYQVVQPSGRNNSVLTYERQLFLIKEYKAKPLTMKAFAKEKGVKHLSTMARLLNGSNKYVHPNKRSYEDQVKIQSKFNKAREKDPKLAIHKFAAAIGLDREVVRRIVTNGPQKDIGPNNTKFPPEIRESWKKEFKSRSKRLSQKAFCNKHGISTSTLHKLLKEGATPVDEPLTIQYFKMHHLGGMS